MSLFQKSLVAALFAVFCMCMIRWNCSGEPHVELASNCVYWLVFAIEMAVVKLKEKE